MIPRIVIEKGNMIRVGRLSGIAQEAWGLEVQLTKDCDHRQGVGFIDNGIIITNPNGWPNPTVNHTITPEDTLITSVDMVNADAISLLKQSLEEE